MEPISDTTLQEWREAESWAAEFPRRLAGDRSEHLLERWRISVTNGVGVLRRPASELLLPPEPNHGMS